jgi:aspartate beta-hydroxylase
MSALRRGEELAAEKSFRLLLEAEPGNLEALQFLALRHFSRGEVNNAIERLIVAHRLHPDNDVVLHQLGTARLDSGDIQGAIGDLRRCLELMPSTFVARLRLGIAFEGLGQTQDALIAYFGAINTAQAQGYWLSDATTAPGLRDVVKRAIQFVDAGRRSLFDGILEPLRQRFGRSELGRVEDCLAIYLGEQSALLPDSRQKPKFLYFPGIPSQPYYPRERFPWLAEFEAGTDVIRDELRAVLSQARGLESFLQTNSQQGTSDLLRSSGHQDAAWDAYFFYRHGERYSEHCARCPQTAALLDAMPLAHVREHSPETLYSVLRPGTHILPHRGVTNTRLVTHLPLIVPQDCALRVGGETHVWEEGRCVTFDDTFEHEAWNNSLETRVVLIVDSWNPDLSEAERAAVADLVGAIGDFNRASEVSTPN